MRKPETRESHLSSCPNIPESSDLGTDETNFQLLIWNLQDFPCPAALELHHQVLSFGTAMDQLFSQEFFDVHGMHVLVGSVGQRQQGVAQVQERLLPVFRLRAQLHKKILAQTLVCTSVPLDPLVNAFHQTLMAKILQEGEHARRCLMARRFGLGHLLLDLIPHCMRQSLHE